jgi:uncharacterized membrane protein HdeD (DUF308 family)
LNSNTLPQSGPKHWWLLSFRGLLVGLLGLLLLVSSTVQHTTISYGMGALMLVSGICAFWFGVVNQRTEKTGLWLMMGGFMDIVLGVVMCMYATGSMANSIALLGLWALLFAFLQAVQAIYAFISVGAGPDYPGKIIHVLLVLASGGLAFTLLMRPGNAQSLGTISGLWLFVMSALLVILAAELKKRFVAAIQILP